MMIPLENISYSLEKLNRNFFPLYPLHKILVHQIQGPSNLVIFYYFQRYPKFSPSLSKSSSTFKSGKWYIEGGYLNKNLHITVVSLPSISNVVKRVTMLYGSLVGCATTIEGAAHGRGLIIIWARTMLQATPTSERRPLHTRLLVVQL